MDSPRHADGPPPGGDPETAGDDHSRAESPEPVAAARVGGFETLDSVGGFDAIVSVVIFIGVNSALGLAWAITGATAWSTVAAYRRRRRGLRIGWYLPAILAYLVARGILGIVFDSEAVYFGIGIATKAGIGVALAVSVFIGRAALTTLVPLVLPIPDDVRTHGVFRTTMARLTLVAAVYELLSAVFDVWLYNNASLNGFLVVRVLTGWVSGFLTIFVCILYANRALSRIPSFDGLLALFEAPRPQPSEETGT